MFRALQATVYSTVVLAAVFTSFSANAAGPVITCINPSGQALYLDDTPRKWAWDGLRNGRMEFSQTGADIDLRIYDSRGTVFRPKDQGAVILPIGKDFESGMISLVVIYPSDGILETYMVTRGKDGVRHLMWTASRDNIQSKQPGKVGAYMGDCAFN
jgi:hypothetical protein